MGEQVQLMAEKDESYAVFGDAEGSLNIREQWLQDDGKVYVRRSSGGEWGPFELTPYTEMPFIKITEDLAKRSGGTSSVKWSRIDKQ